MQARILNDGLGELNSPKEPLFVFECPFALGATPAGT